VSSLSLNDLQLICGKNLKGDLFSMVLDYGPIVGSDKLKESILT
jgi:hypothetical protein